MGSQVYGRDADANDWKTILGFIVFMLIMLATTVEWSQVWRLCFLH
ncbi:MAG: hypothetical protein WCV89_00845 [Candidatus Paceibacterota bacterium]